MRGYIRQTVDIGYFTHNGVLAVEVTSNGALGDFADREARLWVFMGEEGTRDHHILGVRKGSLADGLAFLRRCRGLGYHVRLANMGVPCAGGQRRRLSDAQGRQARDWSQKDLNRVNFNPLPTEEDLVKFAPKNFTD